MITPELEAVMPALKKYGPALWDKDVGERKGEPLTPEEQIASDAIGAWADKRPLSEIEAILSGFASL